MDKKRKNNLYTLGYFVKRLRDCNFITLKIFNKYRADDSRRWTVLVDPENTSVYITCLYDKELKKYMYRLDDCGKLFPKNFHVVTDSMEIIVEKLITSGVQQVSSDSEFVKVKDDND